MDKCVSRLRKWPLRTWAPYVSAQKICLPSFSLLSFLPILSMLGSCGATSRRRGAVQGTRRRWWPTWWWHCVVWRGSDGPPNLGHGMAQGVGLWRQRSQCGSLVVVKKERGVEKNLWFFPYFKGFWGWFSQLRIKFRERGFARAWFLPSIPIIPGYREIWSLILNLVEMGLRHYSCCNLQ